MGEKERNKPRAAGQEWPLWIRRQLVSRGIRDERILRGFAEVSRARFVSAGFRSLAREDAPIPIGARQTVSQPYIIALSLEALALKGTEKVLDVGTGSGFQAVLLSRLAREVYTIEVRSKLHTAAKLAIEALGIGNIQMRFGDGSLGWPKAAPFDAIVVGSRAAQVPQALVDQLTPGGRMVIPVGGDGGQSLLLIEKAADGSLKKKVLERVLFVPLVGAQGNGTMPD